MVRRGVAVSAFIVRPCEHWEVLLLAEEHDTRSVTLGMKESPGTEWFIVDGLGFAGLGVGGKTGKLKGLFVVEEFRHLGIGASLIEARIERARTLGLKKLVAYVYRPEYLKRWEFRKVAQYKKTARMERVL